MLVGSELALDRAQIERSEDRRSAIYAKGILQGYKFIRLVLKNIRKRKISGIDVLFAIEFTNDKLGGITDYQIELRGGDICFEFQRDVRQYIYDMVDTDRNRDFLATHLDYDFWDITDASVLYDVKARYEKIKAEVLKPKIAEKSLAEQFWAEAKNAEQQAIRLARGEDEVKTEVQLQPVAEVANTPNAPGYIPEEPPKIKPVRSVAKRGRPPLSKEAPKEYQAAQSAVDLNSKLEDMFNDERNALGLLGDENPTEGAGVVQP
jgi:hypothetical protein